MPIPSVASPATRRGLRRAGTRVGLGAALAVLVLVVSVVSGSSAVRRVLGGSCASADTPHVGLVLDFGAVADVSGAPSPRVQTFCLPYTAGETGADVLAAATGNQLRWGASSLLCAIDGYPASGCGVSTPSGYQYWSYWHGGSGWTYSTVGPLSYRVAPGSVEGWRFVEGSDSTHEGQPASAASGPCPPVTPTTDAPAPSTTAAAVAASGTVASGGGSTARATPTTSASATATPAAGAATTAPGAGSTTSTDSSATPSRSGAGAHSQALARHDQIAAQPGRGSPAGPLAVAALIAVLIAAAVVVRRRRLPT